MQPELPPHPAIKAPEDRRQPINVSMHPKLAAWLLSRPEGASKWIRQRIREAMEREETAALLAEFEDRRQKAARLNKPAGK